MNANDYLLFGELPEPNMFSTATIGDVIATIAYFAKCNHGKIYGGFVRDYVIPNKYEQPGTGSFTDIDIWFDLRYFADAYSEEQAGGFPCLAKRFAEDIQKYTDLVLVATDSVSVGQVALEYGGGFSRYGVYRKSDPVTELFCIDLVVSDYFPVCDFDVNCLTYDGDKIGLEQPNLVGSKGKHYDFKLDEFCSNPEYSPNESAGTSDLQGRRDFCPRAGAASGLFLHQDVDPTQEV